VEDTQIAVSIQNALDDLVLLRVHLNGEEPFDSQRLRGLVECIWCNLFDALQDLDGKPEAPPVTAAERWQKRFKGD
jgi:hypothetical protein